MATAEQYADWIVKNQSLKGTDEFNTVAEAYKVARNEPSAEQAPIEIKGNYSLFDDLSVKNIPQNLGNLAAGAIRGAGSIGASLVTANELTPSSVARNLISGRSLNPMARDAEMRKGMDEGLQVMGADTNSGLYKTGKIASEIAGTAGVGDVLALGANSANMPRLANALQSGGFNIGGDASKILTSQGGKNLALRAIGGGATGAATGVLIDPKSAGTTAAIGAAIPVAGKFAGASGKAVGKAIAGETSKEIIDLAAKAEKLGINIPADRLTNSKPLNAVAASLNYIPFSGRAQTEALFEKQLNTALSKTFGQNSDNITASLRKANPELGHIFDNTLKKNTVKFDKQFLDDIANTQNQAATELSDSGLQIVNRQIDDIIKKGESGVIDGQAAYNIKKTLDRIGRGNNPEAYHARQLKKDLMNALDRSLGEKGAKEFANVRKQYGTMLDLENLAQNGAEGGISIARLANMKNIKNKELQDLADIAAQFLKPRESQHGAMQRVAIGGIAGTAAGVPALAAGAAAGRIANKVLNSKSAKNLALGKTGSTELNKNLITGMKMVPIASIYD